MLVLGFFVFSSKECVQTFKTMNNFPSTFNKSILRQPASQKVTSGTVRQKLLGHGSRTRRVTITLCQTKILMYVQKTLKFLSFISKMARTARPSWTLIDSPWVKPSDCPIHSVEYMYWEKARTLFRECRILWGCNLC